MAEVDPIFAQWLQDEALWHVQEDTTLKQRWGETARVIERLSALALKADAQLEASRQISFLGGPLVEDSAQLPGDWSAYIGQVITIEHNDLGYAAGVDVFLLSSEDIHSTGLSNVTFLRRL